MKKVHYNRKAKTTSSQLIGTNLQNKKQSSQRGDGANNLIHHLSEDRLISPKLLNTATENNNFNSENEKSDQILLNGSNSNNSPNSCPTCKMIFTSRNSLHNHLATHNTNELRLFLCDLCGHSFKTSKDLSRHASLHDSTKHKTCGECGMTFKTSFHLKRHSLTRHSNLRPFNCIHCEMNFARKDKLKQHEAKHINHTIYQ